MSFRPDAVKSRLREQPFVPFRIITTAGQTYDVYHPDLVLVAQRFLIVGTPSSSDPALADLVTRIALVHVTELRDLPAATPPANGPAA